MLNLLFSNRTITHAGSDDIDSAKRLSRLADRGELLPGIERIPYRIFVTTGHSNTPDKADRQSNLQYMKTQRQTGIKIQELFKPLGGVFDLWQRSGLNALPNAGFAEGYTWPIQCRHIDFQLGHSAPGRLLDIADCLANRAQKILHSAETVQDAIHGAVLAIDSLETLGNRTPTTALSALSLKHQLEVLTECLSYGVEYNTDISSRFCEIEKEIHAISEWFQTRKKHRAALNAEISIISALAVLYRDHYQFDKEQQCLSRIRLLLRHLWFLRNKWWAWAAYPVRWYVEWLLGGIHRFVIAVLAWGFLLSGAFSILRTDDTPPFPDVLIGISNWVSAFFGGATPFGSLKDLVTPSYANILLVWVSMFAIVLGFIHLGVIVSHLYSIIARR